MTLVGGQWSYQPNGGMYTLEETLSILVSCVTGGGNLLLNLGPMPTGEIEQRQVEHIAKIGAWLKPRAEAVYGTRGGPLPNGAWGGSTHRGNAIYIFAKPWEGAALRLQALPWKVTAAKKVADSSPVPFTQSEKGLDLMLPADRRDPFFTVLALTLDAPIPDGMLLARGGLRSTFEDAATYGTLVSEKATLRTSTTCSWDHPADHARLFAGEKADYAFHTANEKNPWVTIDLGAVRSVCGVSIDNRNGDRRSAGLIVALSEDGAAWTEVWRAAAWAQTWDVPVTATNAGAQVPGRPARYLKLELRNAEDVPLLLRRVEVYGR